MGRYVNSNLIKDEVVRYEAHLSLWGLAGPLFVGLVLLPAFGLGLLIWLAVYLRYISTELAITNKRVIAKSGLISRRTIELNLSKIEGIAVDQSIVGRLFDYGSLVIGGTGGSKEPIPGIADPLAFRRHFTEVVDANLVRPQ